MATDTLGEGELFARAPAEGELFARAPWLFAHGVPVEVVLSCLLSQASCLLEPDAGELFARAWTQLFAAFTVWWKEGCEAVRPNVVQGREGAPQMHWVLGLCRCS